MTSLIAIQPTNSRLNRNQTPSTPNSIALLQAIQKTRNHLTAHYSRRLTVDLCTPRTRLLAGCEIGSILIFWRRRSGVRHRAPVQAVTKIAPPPPQKAGLSATCMRYNIASQYKTSGSSTSRVSVELWSVDGRHVLYRMRFHSQAESSVMTTAWVIKTLGAVQAVATLDPTTVTAVAPSTHHHCQQQSSTTSINVLIYNHASSSPRSARSPRNHPHMGLRPLWPAVQVIQEGPPPLPPTPDSRRGDCNGT